MCVALYARAWVEIPTGGGATPTYGVALYARAWVEIALIMHKWSEKASRPLREGVGRNQKRMTLTCAHGRRPLREGVGRNWLWRQSWRLWQPVALYARAWVEITVLTTQFASLAVALYARAWVEMSSCVWCKKYTRQSPSTRGRG